MKYAILICYILLAGIGVFLINDLVILGSVMAVHLIIWFLLKIPITKLKFLWKIKWFIVIIIFFHSVGGRDADFVLLQFKKLAIGFNVEGVILGAIMASKLISMLLITQLVRLSISKESFVIGLRKLGLGKDFAEIIEQILGNITGGQGKGKRKGKGRSGNNNREKEEVNTSAKEALLGRIGNIPRKLSSRLDTGYEQFKNNPNAVVGASALTVTLIRLVKIAPGFPLAPGHKNILLVPVFIKAIHTSDKQFTGTKIGFISGILHFISGFGKYGPLGIIQFLLLGLVIDASMKIPGKPTNLLKLAFVGGMAGLTRISSEIILSFVLGMPRSFYILYLPYFISQVLFGAGSCFISRALIKNNQ